MMKDKMIAVSVIIPIYKVEEYIEDCLVSVLKQTLKNIEIICVDDGTPDHSMEIVQSYADKDERIVVLHKENGGLSSARNAGIKIAKGEYVYFLDSDDYLRENALEILYDISVKNNLDNIFFSAESIMENDEVKEHYKNYLTYYNRSGVYEKVYTGQQLLVEMQRNDDFRPSACLQMARKDLLDKNAIRFFAGIMHEDNLFTLQNITVAERVMCIPDKLYMRRVRENSIMTGERGCRSSWGYFVSIREYMNFIDGRKISEEFKHAILKILDKFYESVANTIMTVSDEDVENFLQEMSIKEQMEYLIFARHCSELKCAEREKWKRQTGRLNKRNSQLKRRIKRLKKDIAELKKINEENLCVIFLKRIKRNIKRAG